MKIVDKKRPTNPSLSPTVWIGSPDSPVGTNGDASRRPAKRMNSHKPGDSGPQIQGVDAAIRKSA